LSEEFIFKLTGHFYLIIYVALKLKSSQLLTEVSTVKIAVRDKK